MKLISLFFILGACSLLNARRSIGSNKWESKRLARKIEPRELLREIAPRKGSKFNFRESGFKMSQEKDEKEGGQMVLKKNSDQRHSTSAPKTLKNARRTNLRKGKATYKTGTASWNGNCGFPFFKPNLERTKIVKGQIARPHSWPWQIEIRISIGGSYRFWCGGTIIAPSVILTAAHCFFNSKSHERYEDYALIIIAGEHVRSDDDDGEVRAQLQTIIHDGYDPARLQSPNDIALLVLAEPLHFNSNISAACLPTTHLTERQRCYSTGWGNQEDSDDFHTHSDVLLQVHLPPIDTNECKKDSVYGQDMKDSMICAGYFDGTKDTCQGDSGGPYVCEDSSERWTVHGIVSWGDGCAKPGKPGIYTRVSSFLDWIKAKSGVIP